MVYWQFLALPCTVMVAQPEASSFVNAFTDKGTLTVECQDPQAVIRYTTDGTFPNAERCV